MDEPTKVRLLESLGVIFCKEGGSRWKVAGVRQDLGGVRGAGGAIWVALAPLDESLPSDARILAGQLLNWVAANGYETA